MSQVTCGLYLYKDLYDSNRIAILPNCLQLSQLNEEALIIRLLTGNVEISGVANQKNTIMDWLH